MALFAVWVLVLGLCGCGPSGTAAGGGSAEPELAYQDYYDLGIRYLSEGNYQEAIIAFTAAIEIDPKQAPAYVGRGDAYVLSGETDATLSAAKIDYEKAIELDETNPEAYLGLADVYIRQGDVEKAKEVLQQGLEKTGSESIQNKITELDKSFQPDVVDQNPIIALIRAGDDGNLLRADEVTFFGHSTEELTLGEVEQILNSNGFYCEYYSDGDLHGGTEKTEYGLYGQIIIIGPDEKTGLVRSIFVSAQSVVNNQYSPINFGVRDICTGDSIETVLRKLGFTNAVELGNAINSISYEEQEQLLHGEDFYYWNNENFGVGSSSFMSRDELSFAIFLEDTDEYRRRYDFTFTFSDYQHTGTYQLEQIYCFIIRRN